MNADTSKTALIVWGVIALDTMLGF